MDYGRFRIVGLMTLLLMAWGCGDDGSSDSGALSAEERARQAAAAAGAQEGGGITDGVGATIDSISCSSHDDCAASMANILECEIPRCVQGKCTLAIAEDGEPCNDFIACTVNDICYNGVCEGKELECESDNPCEVGSCNVKGECVFEPLFSGECNDGDACTVNEECVDGTCEGIPKTCSDDKLCTNDICDPVVGCLFIPNSLNCDDGELCTENDTCKDGQCEGTQLPCEDGNPCTATDCDPEVGCLFPPALAACDDGDTCTDTEFCQGGVCIGNPVSCDDDNPCTEEGCIPGSGCDYTFPTLPCDDEEICTTNDTCGAGVCVGFPDACDDLNGCTIDFCEPDVGCIHDFLEGPCTDNNGCTESDQCVEGICLGTVKDCDDNDACTEEYCDPLAGCVVIEEENPCEDNNVCTEEECDELEGCIYTSQLGPCEDGNLCTQEDECLSGICQGIPLACEDEDVCTTGVCNSGTGNCDQEFNSSPCDDGNPCTFEDTCALGACSGEDTECDDANLCTIDFCEDGVCDSVPIDGETCDDGNPCTIDLCDPLIGCAPEPKVGSCDDGDACTESDICEEGICMGSFLCDDSDVCTEDTCDDGDCTNSINVVCEDENICTDDLCDPVDGCLFGFNNAPCDDGDICSVDDQCTTGLCLGVALDCDDGNPCTLEVCEEGTGNCLTSIVDGACSDGDYCTTDDTCSDGICIGNPIICDDDNKCTTDFCDPEEGCVFETELFLCNDDDLCTDDICDAETGECIHPLNTAPCDDGNNCTEEDTCLEGLCFGSLVTCTNENPCAEAICEPAEGCTDVPLEDTDCEDGDLCTEGDTCLDGECIGGAGVDCNDGNLCTDDSCEADGGCLHTSNTLPCNDNNLCTTNDLCAVGGCSGTVTACEEDGNPCTSHLCAPSSGACVTIDNDENCDDGDACTEDDNCNLGSCQGTEVTCADDTPCTTHGCNDQSGECESTVLNNVPCDDGDPCSVDDQCLGGSCESETINCDDADVCTDDLCLPVLGCVYNQNSGPCEDGDLCTADDTCGDGACIPGDAETCDDDSPCTVDSCHSASGCLFDPISGTCDDGTVCTENDTCLAGDCVGTPVPCDDNNPCTTEVCDPETGCDSFYNSASCDDGDACTTDDICQAGACYGTFIEGCDGPECGNGVCDWAEGEGCATCDKDCNPAGAGTCSTPCIPGGVDCANNEVCLASLENTPGICVGANLACDPVSQTGCIEEEACIWITEDGTDNVAFVCSNSPGDSPALAACPDEPCAGGEACVEGTCETLCLLGAGSCEISVCTAGQAGVPSPLGVCLPGCDDGVCSAEEDCNSCSADCGDCPCGDGSCDLNEDCNSCPDDCGACEVCGNGFCGLAETCENCPEDCDACPVICGDGTCDLFETCSECPEDCGACPGVCDAIGAPLCGGACDPIVGASACTDNLSCLPTDGNGDFLADVFLGGNGICANNCETNDDCDSGICIELSGSDASGTCGEECANDAGCAPGETCITHSASSLGGVCFPGYPCNPSLTSVCYGFSASCMALAGEPAGTGACVTGCFVNSAFGCADPSTACFPKTDALWHSGVCTGQAIECDPVLQNDCGNNETCEVLGGPAYGGVSFYCESLTGEIDAGGDCNGDVKGCSPGLTCFQGLCRAYCFPGIQGGSCTASEACQDIGMGVGVAPGVLGVCL